DLMKKNSVTEFELEKQDFKIRLKRGPNGTVVGSEESPLISYVPPAIALQSPGVITAPAPAPLSAELEIKSPMIGAFYRAPSPEAASYVEVGTQVTPETVVRIIEAMKAMNEIRAEAKGLGTHVSVERGTRVDF